jgi:hypothetical protein
LVLIEYMMSSRKSKYKKLVGKRKSKTAKRKSKPVKYMPKFYTNSLRNIVSTTPELAKVVVALAKKWAKPKSLWIDPCCGNKVFVRAFPSNVDVVTYDIDPKANPTYVKDYLTSKPFPRESVVCGNMPFGRGRSINLAKEMVVHAMKSAHVVVAIVGSNMLRDIFLGKLPPTHGLVAVCKCSPSDFVPTILCQASVIVLVRGKKPPTTIKTITYRQPSFEFLSPGKDATHPNCGIVKWGSLMQYVDGPELLREWMIARKTGRMAGQSTIFFLLAKDPNTIRRRCDAIRGKLMNVYKEWSTTSPNLNQTEIQMWLAPGSANVESRIDSILYPPFKSC